MASSEMPSVTRWAVARKPIGAILVAMLLLSVISSPVVGEWETDNWLSNVIGPERLALGDEFGCHGYEGLGIDEEPWTIGACRDYLTNLTEASRWGPNPISFGLSGIDLEPYTSAALIDAGFEIVGDGSVGSADVLAFFESNGGTLEKTLADWSLLESVEQNSMVSIQWMARIHDLKVREDKDMILWLEQQDVWFTTWGEWHHHSLAGQRIDVTMEGSTIIASLDDSGSWSVPGSIMLGFVESILSVTDGSSPFPDLDPDMHHLQVGWRPLPGGILLTLSPGQIVTIELSDEIGALIETPLSTFNGLHHSVTVVGYHTTNLFYWSSDFQNSELRFTWLVERPNSEEVGWLIPVLAISVMMAVPIAVRYLVNKDKMGPITPQVQ